MKRLKCYPIKVVENGSCREELVRLIGEHIDNYLQKNENKYKGLISVIKVGDNIENENEDEIQKVSLAIVERKGIKENSA